MNQGTVTVDWDQKGGLLVTYPDGRFESVSRREAVHPAVKRWAQQQTNLVARISGQPTIGQTRIEWLNGTNYL